jgi:DNA replicative helicase MCM subunit Mcm2 (Cdc46/Mcm family)
MAHASENANDKALWITLAQSWVRLAEHVARTRASGEAAAEAVEEALAIQPVD